MASSGKKGKKNKGKTLTLTDFLSDTPGAIPTIPIRKSTLNWADEVEEHDSHEYRPKPNIVLPTAPKAARGLEDYNDKIPQHPPYIAYLTNLPYDLDEDEIADFFAGLKISNMKIPKDERPGEIPRLRGFGYVEFEDRDSLLGALAIPDYTIKGRRIRMEVVTSDNDRRHAGRLDMGRDRQDRPEVSMGDWRSGPRADLPESERRGGGSSFSRDRDNLREGPSERDRPGAWRDSDRPSFRDADRDRGFSRDNRFYNRDSDRGFSDRGKFSDRDGDRRGGGFGRRTDRDERNGGFSRPAGREDPPPERSEPRARPKLVLAPRTKPIESSPSQPEGEVSATPVPAASIFGNAKPVDTSARERQIEERLAKEVDKPPRDLSSDNRKDSGRRDDDRMRRNDYSPRRSSPRRVSPRYPSRDGSRERRKGSPDRRSPPRRRSPDSGRNSPNIRRRSPARGRSPMRRRDYRKDSTDKRSYSPDQRNYSPKRRQYTPEKRTSPVRRASPEGRRNSSQRKEGSLDRKASPERRSPERRDHSPNRRNPSPDKRRSSPPRKDSMDRKKRSPDGRKAKPSPDRKNIPRKNDEKKANPKAEKPKEKQNKPVKDREMPKLKEPEPPNFASSNKYAFLQAEGDSDD